MSNPPVVSVIVPTFNRAYCLADTLRTVLAQTHRDFELIVVDDGSTDGTEAMLREQVQDTRLKYIRQNNAGVSAARNTGMRESQGKYIAFCDSDDLWHPSKLEMQVAAMEKFSTAGICWTDLSAVSPSGKTLHERYTRIAYRTWNRLPIDQLFQLSCELAELLPNADAETGRQRAYCGSIFSTMMVGTLINMPTVMITRDAYRSTGEFDRTMRAGEDYDFNLRVCASWPAVFIDAATVKYRVGGADQLTRPELMVDQARNSLRTIRPFIEKTTPGLSASEVADILAGRYKWLGEAEFEAGNMRAARAAYLKSLGQRISQPRVAAFALLSLFPRSLTERARRMYQRVKSSKPSTSRA
jgi:glycosyltransferase involved in cell wall biosynthesis